MRDQKKRHPALILLLCVLVLLAAGGAVYSRFGGFGTGECADAGEFAQYAVEASALTVPERAQLVALGEATHGNAEFQQLKLEVLRKLVQDYGVRAFALEADFGGCETINRYIHGGEGSAREAAAAPGFAIYRTKEMEELIDWMRSYNASAAPGDDLRFYGFDMQRYADSFRYLLEAAREEGIDVQPLEAIWDGSQNAYSPDASSEQRAEVIEAVKAQLPEENAAAIHFADILLQNRELGKYIQDPGALNEQRDRMMAENTLWILAQEQTRGCGRVLLAGHNNHVAHTKGMGAELSKALGSGYFVIGTDFYKSSCNLPKSGTGERLCRTFYSHDPLAKASMACGFAESYLDFSEVPQSSALNAQVRGSIWTGSLGEMYSGLLMRVLPRSYRVRIVPADAYDAMIFVAEATPTEIRPTE